MSCATLGKSRALLVSVSYPVKCGWGLYNLCRFAKELPLLSPWSLTKAKKQLEVSECLLRFPPTFPREGDLPEGCLITDVSQWEVEPLTWDE